MINRVKNINNEITIKNVIISVADKSGCIDFVKQLSEITASVTFFSTGGTYEAIKKSMDDSSRFSLVNIAEFTHQPEMQGGLVKTLDFKIYTGILSEPGNEAHSRDLERIDGLEFDMIVANLYPFSDVIEEKDSTLEDARSHIDIGGPCMLRASAKNFLRVASVCDPGDYQKIINELRRQNGTLAVETRLELAKKTFKYTAEYDKTISNYLDNVNNGDIKNAYSLLI